jgi:hypothetical protein
LLSGGAVWSGSRGTVAAAVGLAVPLLRDAVGLLGCAAVAHLLLAAVAAAAVATASATATTATWTGVRGLVDADGPSVEPAGLLLELRLGRWSGVYLLDVVHRLDGLLGIVIVAVTDETESSAATSVTVFDDDLIG